MACPGCGTETARVHEYRERTAADVPIDGRRVLVKVNVRRMRCAALDCAVQTFREQVPGVLDRYQRRTMRLTGQVSAVARELAPSSSTSMVTDSPDVISARTVKVPPPPGYRCAGH